jgi:hypothetical protein
MFPSLIQFAYHGERVLSTRHVTPGAGSHRTLPTVPVRPEALVLVRLFTDFL